MLDNSRHHMLFDAHQFNPRRVDVIGAGAVGSWAALILASYGVENLHVWDFDAVEAHNLANQFYFPSDIGRQKVDALRDNISAKAEMEITPHDERIEGPVSFGEIVFLCVDSMAARKQIWETSIKRKLGVKYMVETRMGVSEYRIYTVRPTSPIDISGWEGTLYSDENVEPASAGVCRAQVTALPTAMMLGAHAAEQLVLWFKAENGTEVPLENERLVMTSPLMVIANPFSTAAQSAAA